MNIHETASLLARPDSLLEVEGGRIRRVFEAWRDYPQVILCGTKASQAGSLLEKEWEREGTALAMAFIQALEDARGMKVPVAALALRAVLLESSRVQSHLAWIGAFASNLGRKRIAGRCDGLRRVLEEGLQEWLGESLGRGCMVPGGMREDFPLESADACSAQLAAAAAAWEDLSPKALSLPVPRWMERKLRRLSGEAEKSGWVGPMARAVGREVDVRKEEPGVYGVTGWESAGVPESEGILRRLLAVRTGEVTSSLAVMHRILDDPPNTPLLVKRGRGSRGEGFGRCEGPEGETCCHMATEKGRISFVSFSRPRELNRSAACVLEGCRLDEMETLSMFWENPLTRIYA